MKPPVPPSHLLSSRISTMAVITALALGAVSLLLVALGIAPTTIAITIAKGSIFSWQKFSHVLSVWIPLLLCSCGLLFTFRAGLWNIGVEGPVVLILINRSANRKNLALRLFGGKPPKWLGKAYRRS